MEYGGIKEERSVLRAKCISSQHDIVILPLRASICSFDLNVEMWILCVSGYDDGYLVLKQSIIFIFKSSVFVCSVPRRHIFSLFLRSI